MHGEKRPGVFQDKRNGWKRLAASLLLLPGLTAVGAEMLHLLSTARGQERVVASADSDKTELAEKNMKLARAAFDKGDYAKAKELAESVKKMNVGMPFWDDSPDQLLADIQKKTGAKGNGALKATDDDPRTLVKEARAALDLGKLDLAQDRARQAEANSRNTSWGLFEETPADILKAVQKARSKRDRAESEKILNQARGLYERRSTSEELRATNLEKARSLCLQAAQLHGPYSMWDFGDKPQSLIKEIDIARAKLKISARKTTAKETETAIKPKVESKETSPLFEPEMRPIGYNPPKLESDGSKVAPAAVAQSGYNPVKPPASENVQGLILPPDVASPTITIIDPGTTKTSAKAQAVQMMQHASALKKGGKFVEARVTLIEAQKLNANFNADEESPDMALQSLMASAQKHIDKLCRESHETMVKKTAKDVSDAERWLLEADAIATGLMLDRWAIGEHQSTLKSIKTQTSVAIKPIDVEPPPLVLPNDPRVAVQNPPLVLPNDPGIGVQIPPSLVLPADPKVAVQIAPSIVPPADVLGDPRFAVQVPVVDQGMELLRQARVELRRNELENARQIVKQVLNGPFACKAEAQALLRTIDAEETDLRKHTAKRAYDRGTEAYQSRNYQQALSIFKQIDPSLLPPQQKKALSEMTTLAVKAIEKPTGVQLVAGPNSPTELPPPGGADNLLKQEEAMRELQFQKLRSEGLQLEANATARFGKGETDAAVADLNAFAVRVKASNLDQAKIALLVRPIESRVERLKVLKHQQDFLTKEAKDLRKFRDQASQESLQTAHKKEEVARLMKEYKRLMNENNFQEAGKVALMARELDPEDPVAQAAMQISRMAFRKDHWEKGEAEKETMIFEGIDGVLHNGPSVSLEDPVRFNKKEFDRYKNRADTSGGFTSLRPRSEAERKIESMLNSKNVSFNFKSTPLDEVVGYLQTYTGINFDIDTKALSNDNIDPKAPITSMLNNITLKSALEIVLMKANLRFVVDKDVVRVTTQKGARAQMTRRTIPVADLVIPVQNYNPSAVSNLDTMLERSMNINGFNPNGYGGPGANTPMQPLKGLNGNMSTPVGSSSRGGGTLNNVMAGSSGAPEVSKGNSAGTIEESLIRLITTSVHPDTWEAMGGPGRVEYYPLGMALVINQTPDVIEEVIKLLESLRQLQDLEIAIEVRMITLAESFYERMGLDFSMNLSTHNDKTLLNLANGTATGTNVFQNLQNIKNAGGRLVGLQTPGVPTTDLNLPISSSSFGMAIPPFGNYPNAPGLDGGLSVGLAFLSDIQVQMFLDAAQGDRRTNVMQAPKLTMFNGQSANIRIQDQQFFLTGVTVTPVNGVLVFTPQNQPFPLGVTMFMQPVVSGDRRFVRLNIQQSMTNLASATVPLFPITTIVTPQFDGGGQGVPVPFTQYIQQPTFTSINVQTTVVVPDGGTVLLGGLKTLSEGRNEFGPPVISKIPYLNRLFRNVGYGRDAQSLMMMVTPRIIINREEQERQTGVVEGTGIDGN